MSTIPRVPPVPGGTSASRLAYVPQMEAAFWRLYGEFWSHGALDQRSKEVARIRNARVTNCGL
jgi:hypothetical protein